MRTPFLALLIFCFAPVAYADHFKLESSDIKPNTVIKNEQVFNGFGCTGKNISPGISWSHPPKNTKSFALLVHDPDAPTGGSGWWHWLVINIPLTTTSLPTGTGKADGSLLPAGAAQVTTDFGSPGWGGPCPPIGDKAHRYIFTLYALKTEKLEVPSGASAALVGYLVNANSIGKASFIGMYGRSHVEDKAQK